MRDVWNDAVIAEIADLMVYQSIRLPQQASDKILAGVEYIMIDPAYAALQPDFDGPIVVSMGGSDQHGMLPKVIEALRDVERKIIAINGPAASWIEMYEKVMIDHAPESLVKYLNGASLLIGALGMTAYEAAAAGVPSLLTGWSDDHVATAQDLEERGVCFSLDKWEQFSGDKLRFIADELLRDRQQWEAMSAAGKTLVDGHGVERVADRIMELMT